MSKKINNIFKGDKVIWMVFFFLFIISIVEVYSASSSLSYKSQGYMGPIIRHFSIFAVGWLCTVIVMNIRCQYYKIATPILLGLSIIGLLWVLIMGSTINEGSRWIDLGVFQFQPSEIAKGSLILAVAQILSAMQTENGADKKAMPYILIMSACLILPIGLENLSTAALLFTVVVIMMFIGRVPMSQLGKLFGFCTIAIALIIGGMFLAAAADKSESSATAQADNQEVIAEAYSNEATDAAKVAPKKKSRSILHRAKTWRNRLNKFLVKTEVAPDDYNLDSLAQEGHSSIAIASSGITGRGPGNSVERDFLPQAYSDFIYAIIIEEMGLGGAIFVAFLYVILLFRVGRIANRCENTFPALLSMGLALLLALQALINMMVAVGLAPVTGQPLPLISRGGTSTIINCIYIGAILSVSLWAKKKDEDTASVTG